MPQNTPQFIVGDRVKWTSQANGTTSTKQGIVVAVIPAGKELWRILDQDGFLRGEYGISTLECRSMPRTAESYLVAVQASAKIRKRKAKQTLYHPKVGLLRDAIYAVD